MTGLWKLNVTRVSGWTEAGSQETNWALQGRKFTRPKASERHGQWSQGLQWDFSTINLELPVDRT